MKATIKYTLSAAGQKASILAGGDGTIEQLITVERDDAAFAHVVQRGSVQSDGNVTLTIYPYSGNGFTCDAPQTAKQILDRLDAIAATQAAKQAEEAEKRRVETLATLTKRRTTKHKDSVNIDASGERCNWSGTVSGAYEYETAQWPYNADPAVKSSPEAVAWEAELTAAKEASFQTALTEARAQLPAILAVQQKLAEDKVKAAAELTAAKIAMGGEADDYCCRVEDGAIVNVPCYETHKRGKNWMSVITVSPSSPGGLERDFVKRARGDSFYIVPSLSPGDAVEFAADYYSGAGRKTPERWYGFVVAVTDAAILLRPCDTGTAAVKAGEKFVSAKIAANK